MRTVFATTLALSFFAVSAFANTAIEGKYKFIGHECSSGAVPQPIFLGTGYSGSFSIDLDVSSSQLISNMSLQYKMDSVTGATYVKKIQDDISMTQQLPDSPEKQKSLAELQKSLDSLNQMISGYSCSQVDVLDYSLSGSSIHTVPVSQTGNCQSSDAKPSDSTIELAGGILKSSAVQDSDSKICPKGDNVISVFQRVN